MPRVLLKKIAAVGPFSELTPGHSVISGVLLQDPEQAVVKVTPLSIARLHAVAGETNSLGDRSCPILREEQPRASKSGQMFRPSRSGSSAPRSIRRKFPPRQRV
jgi:hypothetical protein